MDAAVVTPGWIAQQQPPAEHAQTNYFWLVSLLMHGVLFSLVVMFHVSQVPDAVPPDATINARLVLPPIMVEKTNIDSALQDVSTSPEPALVESAKLKQQTADTQPITPQAEIVPVASAPADRATESNVRARLNLSPGRALKSLQSATQQALADSANQQRRRLLTSPQLIDPRKGADEPIPLNRSHKINCDKGINRAIGFVSGITGGSLACSERDSDIDRFIDKHKK
ncbi:hypothetical protein [Alteromonas ponticola]|uniref:Energy transducer TonB n=1 Tax=Alteromonas ponticola TaxID=2720613 RepID=A0ABX1R4H9_9ALTE|nr:hypothetical protein [Alteromonas ponticola]NMH60007.1 hypothetical protein [Alteromonas ponticola]